MVVSGLLDTRPLVPLIDPDPNAPPTAACDLMAPLGVACTACPTGGDTCVAVAISTPSAVYQPGLTVTTSGTCF